jgi:hypothetical protein
LSSSSQLLAFSNQLPDHPVLRAASLSLTAIF